MNIQELSQKITEDAASIGFGSINSVTLKQAFESLPALRHYPIVESEHEALLRLSANTSLPELMEVGFSIETAESGNILVAETETSEAKAYGITLKKIYANGSPDEVYYFTEITIL